MKDFFKYILWAMAGLGLAGVLYYIVTYILSIL